MGATFTLTSCGDDDEEGGTTPVTSNVVKSGKITADETWTADRIYELQGRVTVQDGVTLTIMPGAIIKGQEGEGANAAVLMVARGGKLMAVGNSENPIIFTSILDGIALGEKASTLDENDKGKWGGLVILGKAPISADGVTETQIEGVPPDDTDGLYGGSTEGDNSGTLAYVSIRFGGAVIDAAEGNEINGLTLGGVGSGTNISNVEVFANVDDGIEFFGGAVSVTNALVAYQGDDAIDIDQAYSGAVTNFKVIIDENSDEGLEIDGPEGSDNDGGKFNLVNGTIKSVGGGSAADFKSRAQGTCTNVKWEGFGTSTVKIRTSYEEDCATSKTDALTNLVDGELTFATCEFDAVSVYTGSTDANDADCDVIASEQTAAEGAAVPATATGGDATVFSGWTATDNAGLL